ncbi:hypothetical protein FRC12_005333 [Ceratobasidium sp. 428]|nr:hypothetical protein FRC12_005333 [Ceratobasidium sp. 428]
MTKAAASIDIQPYSKVLTSDPSLPISESVPAIESALIQWKATRTLLSGTIQSYLAACLTLRARCSMIPYQPNGQRVAKESLTTIHSELASLALEELLLRDTRISLTAAINNSGVLASVNRLPPEILGRIFTLSRICCARDDGYQINGPAGVCRYWRQITLGNAHLWTHIDIGPGIPTDQTKLLLGRSKLAPVHIHVLEPPIKDHDDEPNEYECEHAAENMMTVLAPHMHCVRTLTVEPASRNGNLAFALLDSWSCYDINNSLPSLRIDQASSSDVQLSLPGKDETPENLEKMLLALTTLHLESAMFGWDSGAYRGLRDLRLHFGWPELVFISVPELASIFAACPDLTILKLSGPSVTARDAEGWVQPTPIVMECLEFVNLADLRPDHATLVLSLITIPGPRAELGIQLSQKSTLDKQLADFFLRSTITTLFHTYCDCESDCDGCLNDLECEGGSFKASKFFPQYLPHIHTLILDMFVLHSARVNQPSTPVLPSPLHPRLQNVVLLECTVDLEVLKRLVLELGIQDLRLERCETDLRTTPNPLEQQELQTLQASLQDMYPHLRCWISDVDSTSQLECGRMFC